MSSITKTTRAAPAAAPRARKRRATAPTLVQPVNDSIPFDPPVDAEIPVIVSHEVSDEAAVAAPARLELEPIINPSTSHLPVAAEVIETTSLEMDDPIYTPGFELADSSVADPVQVHQLSRVRARRIKAIPEGTKVFNGHPLLDPYPDDMLPLRDPDSTQPFEPVIVLDSSARILQDSPLGVISTVKLRDGRLLSDAREAIALTDDKLHFNGYAANRTKEAKNEAHSIAVKWSNTLKTIPAVFVKFKGVRNVLPFVDADGLLDIVDKGFGSLSEEEKKRQRTIVKAVYGSDNQKIGDIRKEIEFENRRGDDGNQNQIFVESVAFHRRRK
ncbi:uncharacterized protein BJ171DRAFT_495822 [Polychytrium aggregatum]|uniref:uncharacterized protein n=1 Tax=Polychytrium aggregatum TaxID=110093 RepID=UPI0022FE1D80|nr:uncharacterized protein BJ171DRAFT_495822 [Polychytrium aggregatum]KAI9206560.1 hypothetical protein BJ171DRAFT_495822 [Polychytrium aggregatum]